MKSPVYRRLIEGVKEKFDDSRILDNKYKIGGLTLLGAGATALYFGSPETVHATSDLAKELVKEGVEAVKEYGFAAGVVDGILFEINAFLAILRRDIINGSTLACDGYGISSEPNNLGYWVGYFLMGGGTRATVGWIASSKSSK